MPVDDAQWDITRCWAFYPGGWHDEYSVQMDGSDTIYNGRVYKKLYIVTHHLPGTEHDSIYTNFLGFMRESDKKVFFISEYLCLDTIERVVYDFNDAVPGDTIWTQILTNGLTQYIPHIVTAIDSVWVADQYHRRIHLRDENEIFTEYWIEGVGSNLGLVYASYWLLTDNSYDLNCFYNEGQLAFTNTEPSYEFCSSPLPVIECDSLPTAIPPIRNDLVFKIYPNPAEDILYVSPASGVAEIRILNSFGQRNFTTYDQGQIDLNGLVPGLYIIQVIGNNGLVAFVQKLIKI